MTAAVIFWALCIVLALIVFWLYVPDVIRRRQLKVMLGGDLVANRAEIDRRFRQIGRKTARDHADQAKFERITGRSGRAALEAALAARVDTNDANYIRDNVIGYFDDDTYIMQMVQHINVAVDGGGAFGNSSITTAVTMPDGPVTVDVTEDVIDRAAKYRPDAQNSHDSAVNRGIRDGLARIRADNNVAAELASIREYAAGGSKYAPAMTTLAKMADNTEPVGTYGMREDAILAAVWARARHPRNSANAENIRDAVIDALADGAAPGLGGGTVCANGRVARVFGALAGLDYDPAVGTLGDMGMWRNQIFNEVKSVIAATAAHESGSADHEIAVAAKFYLGDDVDDCVNTDKFDAILARAIHDTVYKYVDDIGGSAAAAITRECNIYAGIAV